MTGLMAIDPHDWQTIEPQYRALLQGQLTAEEVPDWLALWSDLEEVMQEARAATFRAMTENTADTAAEAGYQHLVTVINPLAEQQRQALKQKLLAVDAFEPGDEHHELLRRLRNEANLFREANVVLQADEQSRAADYQKITGAWTVTLGGEDLTFPQAEQRLLDPDRSTREEAWRVMAGRRTQDREALSHLYLELVPLRQQIARNADCSDYRAYRWREFNRFHYTPENSQALHAAIEAEIVPLAVWLSERRRAQLGVDTLRPWDTRVDPQGRPPLRPFTAVDELEEGITRILTRVGPELGERFQRMRDGFLDLETRKGKALMGYQSFFPVSGSPYIFWNAVGIHLDVLVLLHEAGHACHAFEASAHQRLLWNKAEVAPIEFAELASHTMELLCTRYLAAEEGGFYNRDDARRALQEQLEAVISILRGTCVDDAFQHWVYTTTEELTIDALDAKYAELHQRFYPDEDWSGLGAERGIGWQQIPHVIAIPFYMIEYTLAQLGALQIWRSALQDQASAVERYLAALALGSTRPLPELYRTAGARLVFDRAGVAEAAELLAQQLLEP